MRIYLLYSNESEMPFAFTVPIEVTEAERGMLLDIVINRPGKHPIEVLSEEYPELHQRIMESIARKEIDNRRYIEKNEYTYYLTRNEIYLDNRFRDYPIGPGDCLIGKSFFRLPFLFDPDHPCPHNDRILPYLYDKYQQTQASGSLGEMKSMISKGSKISKSDAEVLEIMKDGDLDDNQKIIKLFKNKGIDAIQLMLRLWECADDDTRARAISKGLFTPGTLGKAPLFEMRIKSNGLEKKHTISDGKFSIFMVSHDLRANIKVQFKRRDAKIIYLWFLKHPKVPYTIEEVCEDCIEELREISRACYIDVIDAFDKNNKVYAPKDYWSKCRQFANNAIKKALEDYQDRPEWYLISEVKGRGRYCLNMDETNIYFDSKFPAMPSKSIP